jgi:uncharacterized membrane protein YphA (DoxX/SURF4 family)
MKKIKIVYWISTALVAFMMVLAAWSYLTNSQIKQAFIHLGFPGYFRIELAIAKIAGAIVLLAPFKTRIKDWAYAGFTIVFVSALIAHISSGDPASVYIMPAIFLLILFVSYISHLKLIRKNIGEKPAPPIQHEETVSRQRTQAIAN